MKCFVRILWEVAICMTVVSTQNFTIGMLRYPRYLNGRVLRIIGRRTIHLATPTTNPTTNDVELALS